MEESLGVLLVDFLRLFGRALDVSSVGVSSRNGGEFYSKARHGMQQARSYLLSVQDPQDSTNDIAVGSFNIQKVRGASTLGASCFANACGACVSRPRRHCKLMHLLLADFSAV
jgi:DNA polymerase sigma